MLEKNKTKSSENIAKIEEMVYTISEVAALLKVNRNYVYTLISNGYLRSIKLVNGVLTAEIFNNIIYNSPVSAATVEPYFRGFLLIIDRVSFDSVEFINVHSGQHPR